MKKILVLVLAFSTCGCVTSGPTIEEPVCTVITNVQHDAIFDYAVSEPDTNKIEIKEKI